DPNIDADNIRPDGLVSFVTVRRSSPAIPRIKADGDARLGAFFRKVGFTIGSRGPNIVVERGVAADGYVGQNRVIGSNVADAETVCRRRTTVANAHIRLEGEGLDHLAIVKIVEHNGAALIAGRGRNL